VVNDLIGREATKLLESQSNEMKARQEVTRSRPNCYLLPTLVAEENLSRSLGLDLEVIHQWLSEEALGFLSLLHLRRRLRKLEACGPKFRSFRDCNLRLGGIHLP
jgi:hypothetical protein